MENFFSDQVSCFHVFGKALFLYIQILPDPDEIMPNIFFWWSLFLILYQLPTSKCGKNNGIGAPVFSNPNGTFSGKVDEMLFNGGIRLAAPELRSTLASLKWCSQCADYVAACETS